MAILCMLALTGAAAAAPDPDLQSLLSRHGVPGLVVAVVNNGAPVEVVAAGVRDSKTGTPVDADTLFEAASLSKPVFAYAVLQLIDAGVLSLDTKLLDYRPDFV